MRRAASFSIALAISVCTAILSPVGANCGTDAIITSISRGGQNFIFNPSFANHPSFAYSPHGTPYVFSTDPANPAPPPLTSAATITFWSLGAGDPAVGLGADSGSYDMVAGNGFSFYSYTGPDFLGGYHRGGQLFGTWEGGTDDCVGPNTCMCVLITDEDGRYGSYAIAGGVADPNVNTFLNRRGTDNGHGNNLPIALVDIPAPDVVSTTSLAGSDMELDIRVDAASAGNYVQNGCACGPVGFKILQQIVPMGAEPPSPRSSAWSESTPALGGPQSLTALGDTVRVESACADGSDVYFATRFFFDSGFESTVVSAPTRIRCSQCTGTDADGDGFCTEASNGVPADCDDNNAAVHPNAEQACDGMNNDCNHPSWPALVGTNELDLDGDGVSECGGDCDDSSVAIGVATPEVCDGVNNNCHDPQWPDLPASEADADGDGWSVCGGDCDDRNATVFPGAVEISCDGVNNDCGEPTWPLLPTEEVDNDRDGSSICGGDCNDGNPGLRPGAIEVCNGVDDDCDGEIDEGADGVDSDADGIPNGCDNCTATYNPNQLDADSDGLGNACDFSTITGAVPDSYVKASGRRTFL